MLQPEKVQGGATISLTRSSSVLVTLHGLVLFGLQFLPERD